MLLPRLHAIAAALLVTASCTVASAETSCDGLGGSNTFSDNLKKRQQRVTSLCGQDGAVYQSLVTPLWTELQTCAKLAQTAKTQWDQDAPQKLVDRYGKACDNYSRLLGKMGKLCNSYASVAAQSGSSSGASAGPAEMANAQSGYGRAACRYGVLGKTAHLAGGFSNLDSRASSVAKETTDATFTQLTRALSAEAPMAAQGMSQKLNVLSTGPNKNDPRIKAATDLVSLCRKSVEQLASLEKFYQERIYADLRAMDQEVHTAESFFSSQQASYSGMQRQLSSSIGSMGASDPIRVKADPSTGAPTTDECPDEASQTPVEKTLKESVFRAQTEDGHIGTLFHAQTTDDNGQPVFHDVTASHVVLEDLHDPANNRIEKVALAPAGDVLGTETPKPFDSSGTTIDRDHDLAVGPSGTGPALPVKADHALATEGQEFTVAGHPVEDYGSNYVNMSCNFLGYGSGEQSGYYVLNCPANNTSMGGVSGGPMVDPKTGTVWGVATNQGNTLDEAANEYKRDNRVFVSPIQQGENGKIQTGPQTYASGSCYEVESLIPRACYVTPMGITYR